MAKPFYLTTPIYYVNDVPHIGHAYTTIAADVLARYRKQCGDNVFFLTGTDEHGQKIEQAAAANNETPKELADRVHQRFKDLWQVLDIDYSDFIRTTDARHREVVQNFFKTVKDNDDIYLGEYEDWYCTPCETFLTEKQLVKGQCPNCGREVKKLKEPTYFFRLSAYQDNLLELYESDTFDIKPPSRKNEIISFVKQGLRDLSLSRTTFDWGIEVPDDPQHVVYVWFDALLNYISALGYGTDSDDKFKTFWPADVHIVGKDILRFHSVYWPAFLLSGGLKRPKKIFAHGWWTVNGQKMSKSLGNVVDPFEMAKKYGTDAFRYFLLQEVPFGQDGNFSIEAFENRINADLSNDLGNLLNRTLGMNRKYFGEVVPEKGPGHTNRDPEKNLIEKTAKVYPNGLDKFFNDLAFNRVLSEIFSVVRAANQYIDQAQPWTLAKDPAQKEQLGTVMYYLFDCLRLTTYALYPFMPNKMTEMWQALGLPGDIASAKTPTATTPGHFPANAKPAKSCQLFPRLDSKK